MLLAAIVVLGKCLDDCPEGAKTRIDVLGLIQSDAFRGGAANSLRACQVHQYQPRLRVFDLPRLRIEHPLLVDVDMQQSMATGGRVIHFLAGHLAIAHSRVDHGRRLLESLYWHLGQ